MSNLYRATAMKWIILTLSHNAHCTLIWIHVRWLPNGIFRWYVSSKPFNGMMIICIVRLYWIKHENSNNFEHPFTEDQSHFICIFLHSIFPLNVCLLYLGKEWSSKWMVCETQTIISALWWHTLSDFWTKELELLTRCW